MSSASGFVRRLGPQLLLAGATFPIVGGNNYYLGFVTEPVVNSVLDLAQSMRMNVLRIWAFCESNTPPVSGELYFQSYNPETQQVELHDGPDGLERLDLAVHLAGRRGMRLILTLTNNWPDFGGMPACIRWFGLKNKNDFYRDPQCRAAYRQWIEQLLLRINKFTGRRYVDEPAILAWELANEPECDVDGGVELLLAWIKEMSSLIKSIDPNHLLSVGDQGYFRRQHAGRNHLFNGSHGVSCEEILGISTVDFGTFHLYGSMSRGKNLLEFGRMWIGEHAAAALRAAKPILLEEYGAGIGKNGVNTPAERADLYAHWLSAAADSGIIGDLVWMIGLPKGPGQPYEHDTYVIGNNGPETAVIRKHAPIPTGPVEGRD